MLAAGFPFAAKAHKVRRSETRPRALPRSMASANACWLFLRSIVRVLPPRKAAISTSVHWSAASLSTSSMLMVTFLRPDPFLFPPDIRLLSKSDLVFATLDLKQRHAHARRRR